jgi:hypothetical protein
MPSDRHLRRLVDEQIATDLIGFAVHGRRALERRGTKSASLSDDPLWPASAVPIPSGMNLWDAFGAIVHAVELKIEWEPVELDPHPYKGRDAKFAGSVRIKSDEREMQLPIGSIVAAFFGNFLNKARQQEDKDAL